MNATQHLARWVWAVVFATAGVCAGCSWRPAASTPEVRATFVAPTLQGYHLQVIANEDYRHWRKLNNPIRDARELSRILEAEYGYAVEPPVYNATEKSIYDRFDSLKQKLTESDSLLIYYSGHGYSDRDLETAYWIPIDAEVNNRSAWLKNDDILDFLKPLRARHILVIADSCYAGKLIRGGEISERLIDKLATTRTRRALTSGSDEPVLDGPPGGHSIFARYLFKTLSDNRADVLRGTDLFTRVQDLVARNADQTPDYGAIFGVGDEGGDYLFMRPRAAPTPTPTSRGSTLGAADKPAVDRHEADATDEAVGTVLDRRDLEQMLHENMASLQSSALAKRWEAEDGPGVAVLYMRNDTSQPIDSILDALIVDVETSLKNTGDVHVLRRDSSRPISSEALEEWEKQPSDGFDASQVPRDESGAARYFVTGSVYSVDERRGGQRVLKYILFMRALDVETGDILWEDNAAVTKAADPRCDCEPADLMCAMRCSAKQ